MDKYDHSCSAAQLRKVDRDGTTHSISRAIASEVPLSIEYGGICYAVMMVTPDDLEDFVIGFSLSEQLIGSSDQIETLGISEVEKGWVARANLTPDRMARITERARTRVSEGSCGLCGLENLDQVMRPLPRLAAAPMAGIEAIFASLDALPAHQPLTRASGAAHAAAFCDPHGNILCLREDIGRHNALDKLVGAMAHADVDPTNGFMLLTARCSYELAEKTILAGCPMLVTISAPSSLAIKRAETHGLTLVSLARPDSFLVAHDPHGLFPSNQPIITSGRT